MAPRKGGRRGRPQALCGERQGTSPHGAPPLTAFPAPRDDGVAPLRKHEELKKGTEVTGAEQGGNQRVLFSGEGDGRAGSHQTAGQAKRRGGGQGVAVETAARHT